MTLDTSLPRYYSCAFRVQGTNARFDDDTRSLFVDGESERGAHLDKTWGTVDKYVEKYEHPVWKKHIEKDEYIKVFKYIYGINEFDFSYQKERYLKAVKNFSKAYRESEDIKISSAPGRTGIGDFAEIYVKEMNRIFGEGSCQKLRIRPVGGIEITK